MGISILVVCLLILHLAILTYFQEFLVARSPFFKAKMYNAKVIGFGRSKNFFKSSAAIEHYTILSYYEHGKEHIVKISRDKGDKTGEKIVLAVERNNKLAVRYNKCNWYSEFPYINDKEVPSSLIFCIIFYGVIHIGLICELTTEFAVTWKIYMIYPIISLLFYFFLKQLLIMRNYLWDKKGIDVEMLGQEKNRQFATVKEQELKRGVIAFLYIYLFADVFFILLDIISGDGSLFLMEVLFFMLLVFVIKKIRQSIKSKTDIPIQNETIILAEVILVDNYHNPKKLICQGKNEQGIIVQYEKMQNMTFSEKPGDTVKVKVDIENENIYEVMSGV